MVSNADRFWSKVDKSDGCWLWTGVTNADGYGLFGVDRNKRLIRAHRWAYEALVGPVPNSLQLDHLCRTRACANPAHLEPVTRRENILRGDAPPAQNARRTRCKNGHEFTPWECPCGALTVAIHVDDGVTPMFLACRYRGGGCGLQAVSMGYRFELGSDIDQLGWEWYLPTRRWARRQGPNVARHVEAGGLVLRALTDAGRRAAVEVTR